MTFIPPSNLLHSSSTTVLRSGYRKSTKGASFRNDPYPSQYPYLVILCTTNNTTALNLNWINHHCKGGRLACFPPLTPSIDSLFGINAACLSLSTHDNEEIANAIRVSNRVPQTLRLTVLIFCRADARCKWRHLGGMDPLLLLWKLVYQVY